MNGKKILLNTKELMFNPKFVLWWSIVWGVGLMLVAPLLNYLTPFLNGSYNAEMTPDVYYRLVLYWHGAMFIPWITILAIIVALTFNFTKYPGKIGRLIKESILIGGFFAVPVAGIAGAFNIYDKFAYGIPLWTQIIAFLLGDEMAIGLILSMLLYLRYHGIKYNKTSLPFYITLLSVIGVLIAAVLGHMAGWLVTFGAWPPIVPQYINSTLGSSNSTMVSTFAGNLVTSHSHMMIPLLMAGIVTMIAMFYGYKEWEGKERSIASLGFVIMGYAIVAVIWIYIVAGIGNYAPPGIWPTDASGINSVAEDDVLTGLIGAGAAFILVALIMHARKALTRDGTILLKDPLFLSVIWAWILIYIIVPGTGYYIEYNETYYGLAGSISGAAGAAFDTAFTRFHQDLGFFILPFLVSVIIAFELCGISGKYRQWSGYMFLLGETFAFVFGEIYSMVTLNESALYLAGLGGLFIAIGVIIGLEYLRNSGLYDSTVAMPPLHGTEDLAGKTELK